MTTSTTTSVTSVTSAPASSAVSSSASSTVSWASATRVKTFAIVFGVTFPLLYLLAEQMNWPLFTFHPATNRVDLWWAAGRSGEGPAMYWYGWTVLALLGGSALGLLGTLLPERAVKKIPLFLLWLLPTLAFIPLAYSLMPFWTKG
jgi:hypothetical protein